MADEQTAGAAQLEFVFQHAATGILLIDRDGRLARCNPAASALLALGDEARGQPLDDLFLEQPALLAALKQPDAAGAPVTLGNRRELRLTLTSLPDGTRLILVDDVTAQRAIDAGRAALVRQVAHDLRNPVNALIGFADLAATEPNATPEQVEYLERVQRIAEKLYSLAGSLVDLAWVESGMPMERRPVHLAEVIRAAADDLGDEALRRESAVTLDFAPGLLPAQGDAARLRQAVGAVLRNALIYAPPGSTVRVRAENEGRAVRCVVQDRGFGFAPADLPKAFDRLWRSSDPRVQAIPGGGIGLTLAQAIVLRHGGRIAIESAPEVGTTVTLMLPAAESG
ncbi:MAG: PAS domain-containing sensor histidine kinase [Anaerolineae bacterium]|nr:PAS domain-containing sensor histidine kinase [Anaerolineae bacterium]